MTRKISPQLRTGGAYLFFFSDLIAKTTNREGRHLSPLIAPSAWMN